MGTNFLKAGLAGLILASTPINAQSQDLKIFDNLFVNNDTTYRAVSYRSEEEGIKDMRKLTKTSKLEEAWIFLPDWNLWYEVGKIGKNYEEKSGNYTLSVILDEPYINKIIKENNNIVLYHFHPEFIPEEAYKIISKQSIKIQTALYSPNDLRVGIKFGRDFSRLHPEGSMKCGLVSEGGIADFYLTKKGIEKYKDWSIFGIDNMVIKPKFNWCLNFKESDGNLQDRIEKIANSMSDDYLRIEFKTHEKYLSELNK